MPQQDAETNAAVQVDETVLEAEDLSEKDSLESNTFENETKSVEVEYKETVEDISTEEESQASKEIIAEVKDTLSKEDHEKEVGVESNESAVSEDQSEKSDVITDKDSEEENDSSKIELEVPLKEESSEVTEEESTNNAAKGDVIDESVSNEATVDESNSSEDIGEEKNS